MAMEIWIETPLATPGATLAAIQSAIEMLRGGSAIIEDGETGADITAYSSGILNFGPGVFRIPPDQLRIANDLGLIFRGQGSRRTNNSLRGRTILLIDGTSSGYGIQVYGNGGRGFTIEDMDICYEDAGFTGDVLDIYTAPGVTLNRAYLGTYGITDPTRLQTARSCVRTTYDEFFHCIDTVMDGAQIGWWSDDVRGYDGPDEGAEPDSDFGGSETLMSNIVFYDFSSAMIKHAGVRTRIGVALHNVCFNPIQVSPERCLDLDNVDSLSVIGCLFTGTDQNNSASIEWARATNCAGVIHANSFSDNSRAGTFGGQLDISGNSVFCEDGFHLAGGVITGRSNEFSKATNGWLDANTGDLTVDLGPDEFKSQVTTSYYFPTATVNVSGRVSYDLERDASSSKFSSVNPRVKIESLDSEIQALSVDFNASLYWTGRGYSLNKPSSGPQAVQLPATNGGYCRLSFFKATSIECTITCAIGEHFFIGASTTPTTCTLASGTVGTNLIFEAHGNQGWKLVSANAATGISWT